MRLRLERLSKSRHPVDDGGAALFHLGFTLYFFLGMGFHAICSWRHYCDWRRRRR